MKLISILIPGVMTIATLGLTVPGAIGATLQVNQTSDPDQLQRILFGDAPPIVIDSFGMGISGFRNYGGFQNGSFLGIDQGLVLSTGEVKPIAAQNCAVGGNTPDLPCNQQKPGADLNFDFSNTASKDKFAKPPRDSTFLGIEFNADRAGRLDFNYVFGSEEFPEYRLGQSSGNDIFYMMLADGNGDLLFEQAISVASIVESNAYMRNPIGNPDTALDGYTNPFNVQMRFNRGTNRLILGIDDGGDDGYDSAVFLQQISVQLDKPQSVPTPSLLLGFTWMGWRRWRDRRKRL